MMLPRGASRQIVAFAVLLEMFVVLQVASQGRYRLEDAFTDLSLLYLAFFSAAAASRIAPVLGRSLLLVLIVPLGLAAVVRAVHTLAFGFAIDASGYRAILQSNAAEAAEFLGQHLGAGTIAAGACALVLFAAVALAAPPVRLSARGLVVGGVCALAALRVLQVGEHLVVSRIEGFAEAVQYAQELRQYRALRDARASRPGGIAISREGALADKPQTYVFIIGESLTRNHMSLYGYWRPTTPALEKLAGELTVFTDAISPHSHTEYSLELALTLADQSNGLRFTDPSNYSLPEMLRAAGFATWWISNQNSFGPWDNKVAVLAAGAQHVHFTSRRSGRFVTGPLDEALLEPFAAALRDPAPRKAIFLHFLGSHWDYAERYPADAAAFRELPGPRATGAWRASASRMEEINRYDNSVAYHDRLAGQVIEAVRRAGGAAAVVLFSDHGETLYSGSGHYWKQFTRNHVEIPLLIWFSPRYAELAGDVVARARANAAQPVALEDLPHLVADLANLRGGFFRTERSPLSASYRPASRRKLFSGSLVYEEADEPILDFRRALADIAQKQPQLQGAIWAHRVNTLGKMMAAGRLFAGVQIDVFYDTAAGALMVGRRGAARSGLALEELLAYADRLNPGLAFWLELGNLDEANAQRIVKQLEWLERRHRLRGRTVVATGDSGPGAAALRRAGFLSSYSLERAAAQTAEGASCENAARIRRTVALRRFAALSYDWRAHAWVDACLGRFIARQKLRRYAWDLERGLSNPSPLESDEMRAQRSYPSMSAVLVPFRSVFDD